MPLYIVSTNDYDTYDPQYVFHHLSYTQKEFDSLVDSVIPKASLALLEQRQNEIAKGEYPWIIDWSAVIGKTVELLCSKHGFTFERLVEAKYPGYGIYEEDDRRRRDEDKTNLIPIEIMHYNKELQQKREEELKKKFGLDEFVRLD